MCTLHRSKRIKAYVLDGIRSSLHDDGEGKQRAVECVLSGRPLERDLYIWRPYRFSTGSGDDQTNDDVWSRVRSSQLHYDITYRVSRVSDSSTSFRSREPVVPGNASEHQLEYSLVAISWAQTIEAIDV